MRNRLTSSALLVAGLSATAPAMADSGQNNLQYSNAAARFSIAVFGDAPYGCKAGTFVSPEETPEICPPGFNPDTVTGPNPGDSRQLNATPAFIDAVNHDNKVSWILHAGDIHSGSQFCTLAYNQAVYNLWKQFEIPLVYTPGDNEWSDCHKSKEGGNKQDAQGNYVDYANGNPVANLALIRSMFFKNPGWTLGGDRKHLLSQSLANYPGKPAADAEYVENVLWEKSKVLFLTLNIPGGSNNDDDNWFGAAAKTGEQVQEVAQRSAADLRWIDVAFDQAKAHGDKAVVIMEQADMWDRDGGSDANHISNYNQFIDRIAARSQAFGKPVLLINGDSHYYRSDNPLKQGQPCYMEQHPTGGAVGSCATSSVNISDPAGDAWVNHPNNLSNVPYDVPNFHRLVVHGSTFPLQYLRLTVDPLARNAPTENSFGPFSWELVIP